MANGEVLQSTALAYDTERRLRFELGGVRGIMPFADCVDAAPGETVKDIAVLTRVGRPTCFVILGTESDENGEEYYLLSRAEGTQKLPQGQDDAPLCIAVLDGAQKLLAHLYSVGGGGNTAD